MDINAEPGCSKSMDPEKVPLQQFRPGYHMASGVCRFLILSGSSPCSNVQFYLPTVQTLLCFSFSPISSTLSQRQLPHLSLMSLFTIVAPASGQRQAFRRLPQYSYFKLFAREYNQSSSRTKWKGTPGKEIATSLSAPMPSFILLLK